MRFWPTFNRPPDKTHSVTTIRYSKAPMNTTDRSSANRDDAPLAGGAHRLLPCPFCGSPARLHEVRGKPPHQDIREYRVLCDGDGMCGAAMGNYVTPEVAADRWNRRVQP